jgi:hypothetical protein
VPATGEGPRKRRKRLVRRHLHLTERAVEARPLAGVAGGPGRLYQREQGVGVAVVTQ